MHQPTQVSQVDQEVSETDVSGGAVEAIGPDSMEAQALDLAVAAFGGVAAASIVLLPEIGAERVKAGQALVARAIGVDESVLDVACLAQGVVRVSEGARGVLGFGVGQVGTDLAADPTSTETRVVDAVEGHGIAVSAKRMAVLVVAASDAGILILVSCVVTDVDGGDNPGVVDRIEARGVADSRVGHQLPEGDLWETG